MMSWTYRPMVTVRVNMTPPARKIAANVATRLRSRNRSKGTTGFTAVRSTTTECAEEHRRSYTRGDRDRFDSQPFSGPWVNPKTAAVQPSVARIAPVASSFNRSLWVSRSVVRAK